MKITSNGKGGFVIDGQDMLIISKQEPCLYIDAQVQADVTVAGVWNTYYWPKTFWGRVRAAFYFFKWLKE